MDDLDPHFTQDWKNHVNETLEDLSEGVKDYRTFKGWLLGLGAGIGGAVTLFAKEITTALWRH